MCFAKIRATGSFVPPQVITNEYLSSLMDTTDDWIVSRTGIRQRHITEGDNTSDLAVKAIVQLFESSDVLPGDIDLIIAATTTADYSSPSAACIIQKEIGAVNAFTFDINAACSGFVYALSIASKYIETGQCKCAVVVGVELLSKVADWSDRSTSVLFGDGAGAVLLTASDKPGIYAEHLASFGDKYSSLTFGYSPPSNIFNGIAKGSFTYLKMDGRDIFNFAVSAIPTSINSVLEKSNTKLCDIKYIIPHQANIRIVQSIAKKLLLNMDKFYMCIDKYGNTSSASIPIALDEMNKSALLNSGDKILISGFGGGLTCGSMIFEW